MCTHGPPHPPHPPHPPTVVLKWHTRRVTAMAFHPLASHVLVSGDKSGKRHASKRIFGLISYPPHAGAIHTLNTDADLGSNVDRNVAAPPHTLYTPHTHTHTAQTPHNPHTAHPHRPLTLCPCPPPLPHGWPHQRAGVRQGARRRRHVHGRGGRQGASV